MLDQDAELERITREREARLAEIRGCALARMWLDDETCTTEIAHLMREVGVRTPFRSLVLEIRDVLRELERAGLATSQLREGSSRAVRRYYSLTDAGAALAAVELGVRS